MKNLILNFIYLTVKCADFKKQYTFVTPDAQLIKKSLQEQFNNPLFPEINIVIDSETTYTISYKKDQQLYSLCAKKFMALDYVKYEGKIVFESDINTHSFKSDILMENEAYKAYSPLEIFLKEHNILKSYYRNEVEFTIKAQMHEYSRDLGQKKFESNYKSNKIDLDILNSNKTHIHDSHVYTSYTLKKIMKITGLDDAGKSISKDILSHEIKKVSKNVEHSFDFIDN